MISSHILTCFQSSSQTIPCDICDWRLFGGSIASRTQVWRPRTWPCKTVTWRLAACRMRVWGWKEQRVAFESICGNWFHVPVSFEATEGYWRRSLHVFFKPSHRLFPRTSHHAWIPTSGADDVAGSQSRPQSVDDQRSPAVDCGRQKGCLTLIFFKGSRSKV